MMLDHELTSTTTHLYGFTGDNITPRGKITLAVEMGESPQTTMNFMKLLVVDNRSAYHGVLGRPALKELGAITSIHHLCKKFPMENGVATVRSDQRGSRECYLNSIRKAEPQDIHVIIVDKVMIDVPGDAPVDPKDVEMIDAPPKPELLVIDEIDPLIIEHEPQASPVSKGLSNTSKEKLKDFLSRNLDIFAWRHEGLVGIDPKVSCHHLKIDPKIASHRQKGRALNPERYETLKEEVRKLIKNGFIREATYPMWVSNLVLVKKHSGKWKVCIDFTNLNRACPKDSFPLPSIDQLVDSIAGHELLSFMDVYSGYNQIPMHPADEEHTSFIIDRGLYFDKMMPFSWRPFNAPQQHLPNLEKI
ncbi:uncharacterized protein LOC111377303 [Olea europaea var. sylvestris]|uniref:uncharacterized protein LOC111377303 n=1 Tax=Olea europaea var. sylvestris TaxID=158386 RepID=UPI000C1D2E3F|nr:uncharacterized protein LOC111377303 [Olea europaea var. sylvestris]